MRLPRGPEAARAVSGRCWAAGLLCGTRGDRVREAGVVLRQIARNNTRAAVTARDGRPRLRRDGTPRRRLATRNALVFWGGWKAGRERRAAAIVCEGEAAVRAVWWAACFRDGDRGARP